MKLEFLMLLFDGFERTNTGPAEYAEPSFSSLNNSAQITSERVRDLLQSWFDTYPDGNDKQDLRNRFQADDEHHIGAFFELYCYALLRSQGYQASIHQIIDSSVTNPVDFLIVIDDSPVFCLESTVAQTSALVRKAESRWKGFQDSLNRRLTSRDFFVAIEVYDLPKQPPSASRLSNQIDQWLDEFDVDDVATAASTDASTLPRNSFTDIGWRIFVTAIPKQAEARRREGSRPIGLISQGWHLIQSEEKLLSALQDKATRYGYPPCSYIIAVDAYEIYPDIEDIQGALLGRGGLWNDLGGDPHNTRVSAVLVVSNLNPYTVTRHNPALWHNPWAEKPLDPALWQGPQRLPNGEWQPGRSVWELFNLERSWPE